MEPKNEPYTGVFMQCYTSRRLSVNKHRPLMNREEPKQQRDQKGTTFYLVVKKGPKAGPKILIIFDNQGI